MIRTQQRTCIRATVCWAVALACLVISARADDRPAARAAVELHAGRYDVRARAARLLGYLGGAEHGPALADMVMRDRARQPREAAAVALAQIGAESYGTFVVARLAGELGTPDPDLRMELAKPFILPCATLSSPEYLALMARLTADKDPRLRRECLKCLPLMPAGSGLQFGIAALDDPDQDHHALALQALIWCVDADTAAALAGRLMTEQPSEGNALCMLRAMAAPAGLEQPSATAGLRHPAPAVRALAAALASRVPGTRSQLVSACHDAAPGVRREAIAGLGRIDPGAAARIAMGNPARDALIRKHSWAADSPAADELVLGTFMADEGHGVWRAAECVARQRDGMTVLTRLARSADAAEANAAVRMLAAEGTLDASRALAACIWTEQGGLAASAPPVVELALRGLLVADEPLGTAPMPGPAQGLNEDALCRLIDALGAMGTQEAAARVRGIRANWMTTEGRLKRVRALAPVEGTEAQQALLEALNDHDARVRQLAADALMWRGGEDRSVLLRYAEGLEGNVRDSVLCSAVRHAAVSGLLRPDRCGVEELRAVASQVRGDTDDPYQLALCAAAGLDGAEYMLRHALLGAGTDAKARVELCRAVGNIGGGPGYTALGELLSMLADDAPAAAWHSGSKRIPLLLAAIEAMGFCGDPKFVFLLEPFLADAPTIRAAALRALARLMPERWSALCERALFDGDDGVRSIASGLAAGLSDRGARALLREFSNAETGQKAVLIASLGRCFCPAARDALRRIAASGDAPEAARAAWALAGARASEDNLDAALLLVDSGLLWVRDGCRDEDRRSLLAEGNSCRAKVMLAAGHPQAVRWARLAYLDEPRPETLNLIADCIALNGHGERAGHLRRVAAWQKYELAANDSK